MTVYVDDMYLYELGKYGRMKMSHMIADSDEELHEMATKIGVARKYWQVKPNGTSSHYDIALSKREKALEFGAVPITMKQAAAMNRRKIKTGELGSPEDAIAWFHSHKA